MLLRLKAGYEGFWFGPPGFPGLLLLRGILVVEKGDDRGGLVATIRGLRRVRALERSMFLGMDIVGGRCCDG